MVPGYLKTFRRAVRELEGGEKSEISEIRVGLFSLNSLISHPLASLEGRAVTKGRKD